MQPGIAVPLYPPLRRSQRRVLCRQDLSAVQAILFVEHNIKKNRGGIAAPPGPLQEGPKCGLGTTLSLA